MGGVPVWSFSRLLEEGCGVLPLDATRNVLGRGSAPRVTSLPLSQ